MAREHILVVDDEADMREACSSTLTRAGFQVSGDTSGLSALERVRRGPPDLIVVDMRMPGMDGLELLGAAWRMAPGMPAVMITGYPGFRNALHAGRAGYADYLPKPFTPDELTAACERALNIARRRAPAGAGREGGGEGGEVAGQDDAETPLAYREAKRLALERFDRGYIEGLLGRYLGNVSMAARVIGTNRRILHRLMRRYRLRAGDFRR